jgi:hypothetical protein
MYPAYVLQWQLRKLHTFEELEVVPVIVPFKDVSGINFPDRATALKVLQDVRTRLKRAAELPITQDDIDGLPPIGSKVWAIKEWSGGKTEVLEVEVTEYSITDGKLCVVFGFYYKPHTEVWKTRREAEAFLRKQSRT